MDDKFESLGKIIRNYMRRNKIPGLSISIFQEDKIIYSKGFGARDLERFLPMTPQTLIGIGSITKSITAFGIMKLIERGKLNLEDSASKYLDFAPFKTHPDMTIKNMLSHTTGVVFQRRMLVYLHCSISLMIILVCFQRQTMRIL